MFSSSSSQGWAAGGSQAHRNLCSRAAAQTTHLSLHAISVCSAHSPGRGSSARAHRRVSGFAEFALSSSHAVFVSVVTLGHVGGDTSHWGKIYRNISLSILRGLKSPKRMTLLLFLCLFFKGWTDCFSLPLQLVTGVLLAKGIFWNFPSEGVKIYTGCKSETAADTLTHICVCV